MDVASARRPQAYEAAGGGVRGLSPALAVGPGGKTLVEGYRQEVLNNFEQDTPLYNPLNPTRPQSSPLVDLKDPIQVHLLTETALSDSREWTILSQEEVDDLKKQIQSLAQRIEQARTNLAIQSKYRDAAISMSKLYSPPKAEHKRRSLLGNRHSGEMVREAEMERQASERRCEELAAELFSLEKRIMEPQRRLLQHTAGILQLTHRGSRKKAPAPSPTTNGIPGSPESLYTYSHGRDSLEAPADGLDFDDAGLYFPLDQPAGGPRTNAIEIPVKSPVRGQAKELREESDRLRSENSSLRGENDQLRLENDSLSNEVGMLEGRGAEQWETISTTQRRLEDLNARLRDVIVQAGPEADGEYDMPPAGGSDAADVVARQLDYMDAGLEAVRRTARRAPPGPQGSGGAAAEADIEGVNRQVWIVINAVDATYPAPPETGHTLDDRLEWLREAVRSLEAELLRAVDASGSSAADRQKAEQVEAVLSGLWDVIQSGFADIQQRKQERRRVRLEKGLQGDDEELSGDEGFDLDEPYSLPAFSTKVQWLYSQATSLKEQKSVLKRQIKQQRELNNKTDSQKDAELRSKIDELLETKDALARAEKEAAEAQQKLDRALGDLDAAERSGAAHDSDAVRAAQGQLEERDAAVAALEATAQDLQGKLARVETQLVSLSQDLGAAAEAKRAAAAEAERLQGELRQKDEELDKLNLMVVELKTEATIARAELDGAYGSRAQRAAEAAALTNSSETDRLRSELAATLRELEDATREAIASEKEKGALEAQLDGALAERSSLDAEVRALRGRLDAEVGRLRDQLDAERLRPPPSPGLPAGRPGTGASMLSEQFRATMKEERKRFQEELREEQARRRKLEDDLRALRKAQGPGRSPLSPSPLSPR